MKKILITGANSYVGTNVEKWLMNEPDKYYVETLDMKDPKWKEFDFSKFDVVFHVAGIAHVSRKKSLKDLYFKVNRDLTIEVAIKSKESNVSQFIFMSSMIVFNSKEDKITIDTKPDPDNFYGLSKLQAEQAIIGLSSDDFNVCVLRPPMIYGPGSKGNFSKLVKFSKYIKMFPLVHNKKSIIFIDNLSEFIKLCIDDLLFGIYHPQNSEFASTSLIINKICLFSNKRLYLTKLFNRPLLYLVKKSKFINKIFGDFYYSLSMSNIVNRNYIVANENESIKLTVSKK